MSSEIEALKRKLNDAKHELLRKHNAHAVGIGYKYVNGKRTNQIAIVFFVYRKRPLEQLRKLKIEPVPQTLFGYVTDVRQVPKGFTVRSEKEKHRPFSGGVSGISMKEKGAAGTLGLVSRKGEVLSCNHVLANESLTISRTAEKGDPFLQPSWLDDANPETDIVGKLDRWVDLAPVGAGTCPIGSGTVKLLNFLAKLFRRRGRFHYHVVENNYVDGAVGVAYEGMWEPGVMGLGEIKHAKEEPELGEKVMKRGRTTGLTKGVVTAVGVEVDVAGYQGVHVCHFTDQIAIEGENGDFSQPGDSIAADTLIYWLEDGILRFGTVEEAYQAQQLGRKLKVLSPKVLRYGDVDVDFVDAQLVYHGVKDVYRVVFRNGSYVDITSDHSLFRQDNYKLFPITLEEAIKTGKPLIHVEDLTPVNHYSQLPECLKSLNLTHDELKLLMEFCGLWVADGNYDGDTGEIRISTGYDENVISLIKEVATQLYDPPATHKIAEEILDNKHKAFSTLAEAATYYAGKYGLSKSAFFYAYYGLKNGELKLKNAYTVQHKSKGDYRLYSKKLQLTMKALGFQGNNTVKRVPQWMFTAPKELVADFLRGYFSGDGWVERKQHTRISVGSANRLRLQDVKILLLRFGIKSNIGEGEFRPIYSPRPQYKLKIEWARSCNRFGEIGFINKPCNFEKKVKYNEHNVGMRNIRSVTYLGKKRVFDFKVPRTEAFITAQGILCHNSGSCIVTQFEPYTLVGLLFAGGRDEANRDITIASPYKYVKRYLDYEP